MRALLLAALLVARAAGADSPSFGGWFGKKTSRSPKFSTVTAESGSPVFEFQGAPALADQCAGANLEAADGTAIGWSRSTGKYCAKSDGTLVWMTANQPALEANGLNIEGASQNLLVRSQEIDTTASAWTHDAVTVAANAHAAPDGTTTAETVTSTTASAQHRIFSPQIVLSGRVTISIFAGAVSGSAHWARITSSSVINAGQSCNIATCAAGTTQGSGGAALPTGGCQAHASGYCRLWVTYTGDGTNGQRIILKLGRSDAETVSGTNWSGEAVAFKVWGGMQENAEILTSYYPASAAAATRAADAVSFTPTSNIAAIGCASATATYRAFVNANGRIFGTSDTSAPAMVASATTSKIADGTNTQTVTHSNVANSSVNYRAVWSSATGLKNLTIGGTSGTADTFDGTMNTATLYLGSRAGTNDFLFGHLKSIKLGTSTAGCQ